MENQTPPENVNWSTGWNKEEVDLGDGLTEVKYTAYSLPEEPEIKSDL